MFNDLVSIIMPSYNTGKYIANSIKSVLAQSYYNWELIIVDDCSADDTDYVVKQFLKDKRIRFYKNNKNLGAAVTRNRALKLARGRWIAFLDSDDLWSVNKLEIQLDFMIKNDYHFSYTNYYEIDAVSEKKKKVVSGPNKINKYGMYLFCWPGCLTVIYDADFIGLVQIENIAKNNDYALWLKICKKAVCYKLDEVLASYKKGRDGSISNNNYFLLLKWHFRLFRIAEKKSVLASFFLTMLNVVFGIIKKIFYIRKANE